MLPRPPPSAGFGFTADQMEGHTNVAAWREAVATLFDVDELAADEPGPFRADIRSFAAGTGADRAEAAPAASALPPHAGDDCTQRRRSHHPSALCEGQLRRYRGRPADPRARRRHLPVRPCPDPGTTKATAFRECHVGRAAPDVRRSRLARIEDLHGLVLPESGVIARLLAGHLTALLEFAPRMTLDECQSVVEGTVSLLAACLRNELDAGRG